MAASDKDTSAVACRPRSIHNHAIAAIQAIRSIQTPANNSSIEGQL
jgi:hypothetical protein